MNCTENNNKYLVALIAVAMVATVFVTVADVSSADTTIESSSITADGFMHDKTGTLHIRVLCNDESDTITVSATENGNILKSESIAVVNGWNTVSLSFQLSQGHHDISVTVVDGNGNTTSGSITLDVSKSVWSNITTYLAIAVLAIIVLAIAVVYMRSNPRNKPTTTFTELENAKNAAKSEEPAKPTRSTGKIKYESSRRK